MNASQLNELGQKPALSLSQAILRNLEDEFIPDDRVSLRPSEIVQLKLFTILPKGTPIPVSCHHNCRVVNRYRETT